MASQLTTPTHHVMLFSHCQCHCKCHCCGYLPRQGNLRAWNFAWRINIIWFYFGELKNYLHFLRTDKRSLLGGVTKVHFVCLKCYRSLLPISKSWSMHGYHPPRSKKKTPAMVARTSWHHHYHFYTKYATFTVLRQDSTANEGYLWLP